MSTKEAVAGSGPGGRIPGRDSWQLRQQRGARPHCTRAPSTGGLGVQFHAEVRGRELPPGHSTLTVEPQPRPRGRGLGPSESWCAPPRGGGRSPACRLGHRAQLPEGPWAAAQPLRGNGPQPLRDSITPTVPSRVPAEPIRAAARPPRAFRPAHGRLQPLPPPAASVAGPGGQSPCPQQARRPAGACVQSRRPARRSCSCCESSSGAGSGGAGWTWTS